MVTTESKRTGRMVEHVEKEFVEAYQQYDSPCTALPPWAYIKVETEGGLLRPTVTVRPDPEKVYRAAKLVDTFGVPAGVPV